MQQKKSGPGSRLLVLCAALGVFGSGVDCWAQPKPKDRSVEILEGQTVEVTLEAEYSGDKQLVFEITEQPKKAKAPLVPEQGKATVNYEPQEEYAPEDSFRYTVKEKGGTASAPATVQIKIKPAPPKFSNWEVPIVAPITTIVPTYTYSGDKADLHVFVRKPPDKGLLIPESGKQGSFLYIAASGVESETATFKIVDNSTNLASEAMVTFKIQVAPSADLQDQLRSVKQSLPDQFSPDDLNASAECVFAPIPGTQKYRQECAPSAIAISSTEVSTVRISVPPGTERVLVSAGENFQEEDLNQHSWGPGCGILSSIHLQLYKVRAFRATYLPERSEGLSKYFMKRNIEDASTYLRPSQDGPTTCPSSLSLLLSGRRNWVNIAVEIRRPDGELINLSSDLELLQHKWLVDVGGFYGIRYTGDQELLTRVVSVPQEAPMDDMGDMGDMMPVQEVSMTEVLRIDEPDYSSDSGMMLNFFHRSYPYFGLGVGLTFPSGRAPSYYIGPNIRLLNLGARAVATLNLGVLATEVKTFPGIKVDELYDPNDPRLSGRTDYTTARFVAITLGFELPVGGGK